METTTQEKVRRARGTKTIFTARLRLLVLLKAFRFPWDFSPFEKEKKPGALKKAAKTGEGEVNHGLPMRERGLYFSLQLVLQSQKIKARLEANNIGSEQSYQAAEWQTALQKFHCSLNIRTELLFFETGEFACHTRRLHF